MLPFAPPYDWDAMLGALAARLDADLEKIADGRWQRRISLDGTSGSVEIGMIDAPQGALRATIRFPAVAALPAIVRRIRRVFDLSADPIVIGKQLADDPLLAPLVRKRPGLRVPGAWEDAAEADDEGLASYDAFDPANGELRAAIARLTGHGMIPVDELRSRAERWRPWRAYAAAHLLVAAEGVARPGQAPRTRKVAAAARGLAHAG
jgi:AraC family transcriptional regulator of adaptative response / DNA-3-methyladenine glycosylase II